MSKCDATLHDDLITALVFAKGSEDRSTEMWHGWNMGFEWGWGGWLLGGLMMLLFWGGVITLALFAVRALVHSDQGRVGAGSEIRGGETALEILQKRYARGEINRQEYKDMRHDLER
jgi:putative membrane protein